MTDAAHPLATLTVVLLGCGLGPLLLAWLIHRLIRRLRPRAGKSRRRRLTS